MDVILQQISAIQLRRRFIAILTAVVAFVTIGLGAIVVLVPLAAAWTGQPPAWFRWTMLAMLVGVWVWALVWYVVRSLLWKETVAQTARQIESVQPDLRNDFINSILLAKDKQQASPELVQMAIHEAARRAGGIDMSPATSMRRTGRWSIAAGAGLLLLIGLHALAPGMMSRGWAAMLSPTQYLAQIGSVAIIGVSPGDARVFMGEQVKIVATVDNPSGKPLDARLLIEGQDPIPMYGDETNSTFTFVDTARGDVNYAVEIGGSRFPLAKPYYSIEVMKKAELEKIELVLTYPEYTGKKPDTIEGKGDVEAITGTEVAVRVTMRGSIPPDWSAMMDFKGGSPKRMTHKTTPDGHLFEGAFTVNDAGSYRVELRDSRNDLFQCVPASGGAKGDYFNIKPLKDRPPTIEFIVPTSNATVKAGGTLDTRMRVTDDYAITDVSLYIGRVEGDSDEDAVQDNELPTPGMDGFDAVSDLNFSMVQGKDRGVVPYTIKVPRDLPEGAMLDFYATVTDNKPGTPQRAVTYKMRITVQDPTKLAAEKARLYEELQKKLFEMLELQEHQRVNTALASKMTDLKDIQAKGKAILDGDTLENRRYGGQVRLRAMMIDLVEKFDFPPEMVMVQQAVAGLSQTEAPLAIEQAQVLIGLGAVRERTEACTLLGGTQNRIINALQGLLAIMPSLAREKNEDYKEPQNGYDLPSDVQDKLAELKTEMEDLIESQRKIIKESAPLGKKPVDEFTNEDFELLEKLKTQQTDWEKFMKDKFTDFSKLSNMDFSNPSVMKEILAVKSDITMAKDALASKSSEIATALEDNGIENAKSLKSNLEKWLTESPPHGKWQMEAPGDGQENVEMPELPKDLQDLVGDLLEEEEDLFEEMEDNSSKYNQSGDAIGWDALDGPISNMNAQGVTGNALPKNNDIEGRSGEGRQGRASGEMVEDEAQGKGGRRTPTRLENNPFQKGQIKDKSEEAPGGSTGGGKRAGWGEEGLEGPVPPPTKDTERIAGKQATLLNRAERIQNEFEQADLSNFKLLQSIVQMNKVRDALENNRYENALRAQQGVVENLRKARLYLSGDIDIRTDASVGMPKYVQQEINDAANRNLPEEFKEPLQEYYRVLSTGLGDEG